ncbi:hypothetical protein [Marinobacter sp. SS21]|uniref:hypothetical protein n=1 Tax=Marinobacter sp. SS21 TaxID=2979460 RepID=UPI00232EBBC0|nr:hypothetical protein [Marinobacter sp. SS21]MDC0663660.1 hypothetical protein [Marinobacter sp. SS21]
MSDSAPESTPTRTLQQLEQSRKILQRLIRVAGLIEGLKHSLENMLAQDSAAAGEAPGLARLIDGLEKTMREYSDDEVTQRLDRLDERLRVLFGRLAPFIAQVQVDDTPELDLPPSDALQDVGELKRSARTALTMRGLLARRGAAVPEFRLPLNRNLLQSQLQTITHEARSARQQVIQQVQEVDGEIRQMLEHGHLPEAMQELLQQMLEGLQNNLAHLDAGQSVSELPLPIEEVSFAEPQQIVTPSPSSLSASPQSPSVQSSSASPSSPSVDPELPVPQRAESELQEPAEEEPLARPGLFRSICLWVKSPWHVSWREIRSGQYRALR